MNNLIILLISFNFSLVALGLYNFEDLIETEDIKLITDDQKLLNTNYLALEDSFTQSYIMNQGSYRGCTLFSKEGKIGTFNLSLSHGHIGSFNAKRQMRNARIKNILWKNKLVLAKNESGVYVGHESGNVYSIVRDHKLLSANPSFILKIHTNLDEILYAACDKELFFYLPKIKKYR